MQKTLFLMRHAEAAAPSNIRDSQRPLTARGDAMAKNVGAQLVQKNIMPQKIIHSPALRTRATTEGVMQPFFLKPEVQAETALYGTDAEWVLRHIQEQGNEYERLMVVGHNPWIHALLLSLIQGEELKKFPQLASHYPPSSCAIIGFDREDWANVQKLGQLMDYIIGE